MTLVESADAPFAPVGHPLRKGVSTVKSASVDYYPTRFKPDVGAFAQIDLHSDQQTDLADFNIDITVEIENESYSGCRLIVPETEALQIGDTCIAKVGFLKPMRAIVVWRSHDDDGRLGIGLEYDE